MKKITLAAACGLVLLAASCSQRATQIPERANETISNMNALNVTGFRKHIATSVADRSLLDAGSFNLSNLLYVGSNKYTYFASNWVVPTSGETPTTTADAYYTLSTNGVVISSSGKLGDPIKMEWMNAGNLFGDDWKITKIYLPGNSTAIMKLPGFLQVGKP